MLNSMNFRAERVSDITNILVNRIGFAPIRDKNTLRRYIDLYDLQLVGKDI